MTQKITGLLLASTVLIALPITSVTAQETPPSQRLAVNLSQLVDIPSNHWAYRPVKYLVEELEVMSPRSAQRFAGDQLLTRYELAEIFYRVVKKLEQANGKDLRRFGSAPDLDMVDLNEEYRYIVTAVVNEYGIMQPLPFRRFMGDEPISRYELAFELYNYFSLIESYGNSPALAYRDRAVELKDLPEDHWATKAVIAIVNKYQIMDGYPSDQFLGNQRLTRYEAAATIREFIRYVDDYLMPIVPSPTPLPTPRPTPEVVVEPTPEPTPVSDFKTFDLRLGGDFRLVNGRLNDTANILNNSAYGPSAALDLWGPLWRGFRFGLSAHGDYMLWRKPFDFTDYNSLQRLTAGGGIKWRILGAQNAGDFGLSLGLGYDIQQYNYTDKANTSFGNFTHGPTGNLYLEWPWGSAISWVIDERFTWFIGDGAKTDRFVWRNDLFAGINLPALTPLTFEIGYRDTRYIEADEPSRIKGDQGVGANLRLRF